MAFLLKDGMIFTEEGFKQQDVFISETISFNIKEDADLINIDCSGKLIIPGLTDVHVHFREPGFFYKESIETGSRAGAAGGYTAVCTMPNLNPPPVDRESLNQQLDIIERDAVIRVYPYGAITAKQNGRGELSDMEAMAEDVVAFSDDGVGVQDEALMEKAMIKAASLDKLIVAHCEDNSLNDGPYMGTTSASESVQAIRDMKLSEKIGCKYHICHVSAKETVEGIREAKKRGVNVTAETAPHYLIFSDDEIKKTGSFKMNPPIKKIADKEALIEAVQDGTIDMIATDHAPHSTEEKSKGFEKSLFGVVGLETAFGILNAELVSKGIISMERLIEMMAIAPRRRFNLPGGYIEEGQVADLTIIDPDVIKKVNPSTFQSKGRSTPFEGMEMKGEIIATFVGGKKVW